MVFGRITLYRSFEKFSNIIIATGHSMMGISLGPATGKLVSELVSGKQASADLSAFEVTRFG